MSGIDDAEYQRLAEAVRATEKLAAENPNIRQDAGAALLMDSKARIEVLENEFVGPESSEKKDKRHADSVAIAALVDRETRLNSQEKEAYADFLEKDYFTKKDFKDLDVFYASSYDKLSEEGKAQMSERIQEGIRRGEFRFSDLPEHVQERENAFQKAHGGKVHEIVSGKGSFEKQPQDASQAATERSEVADAAEKTVEDEDEKSAPSKTSGLSAFSDLPPIGKSSEASLSLN